MGNRTFGERIFFQGKPASNPSVAWTLAAVAERDVMVPPNPGAMGAWGIALCALEEIDHQCLLRADPWELSAILDTQVVEQSEFQCRDSKCETLCRTN